jgi:hypothetical protein
MQNRPSRQLWLAAIVVSILCVGSLAWGLINDWDEPAQKKPEPAVQGSGGSGFGLGLMIGLGAGVVVGSLIALRKRQS